MSGFWSGNTKCIVVLSFDVDGVSGAINQNPETRRLPSLLSMREYGPSVATPRILEMLEQEAINASFFIPGYVAETHEQLVIDIKSLNHEIAHHGYMHEPPATLSEKEESEVLDRGINIIQSLTGEPPKGYRSPSWELSDRTLPLLEKRGFTYDSSLMGNDIPYMVEANEGKLVEIPVHWQLDDAPYFNYSPYLGLRNPMTNQEDVYQIWSAAFEELYYSGQIFVLTMHPWIIGRPGRLSMLQRLITYIKSFSNVQFMTAYQLAKYWEARNKTTAET